MLSFTDLLKELNQQNILVKTLTNRLDVALNTITLLQEENQKLKDEIARLKGQKPKPKIPPSILEGANSKEKSQNKMARGTSPRRKKTKQLNIHIKTRIKPASIPKGAIFKGIKKFTVQDIIIQPNNTLFELERWQLPDGTYVNGKLPENIQGHYGPQLITYILYQYYGCRVTQPLLLSQLKEIGILISEGQLNNILIFNKQSFHEEKNDLLSAGILAGHLQVDDTGARHKGQNGYSTVIGNDYFTTITSTDSKSRINFFQILHGTNPQYLINEDTIEYIEKIKPKSWLSGYLLMQAPKKTMNQEEWDKFLININLTAEVDIKLAIEATLFASLIENGIPKNLGIHGDDAGQFDAFVRSLCWIHQERHYRKIIAADEEMRKAIEEIREGIWDLYKGLKAYKLAPSTDLKTTLEQKFEALFSKKTISSTLNKQLEKTYSKKEELLRVLEDPATPLHNNGTETDCREMVVKKKVSGGTRSNEGRKCRDTFISLKKTCQKIKVNFLSFLKDRINKKFDIPELAEIIKDAIKANSS
jgi:hypothetical protein